MPALTKNTKALCAFLALGAALAAIGLAITSTLSYPKSDDTMAEGSKKLNVDVPKYQNLALVLAIVSIALYLACQMV
jgi:uncharacterized membrane protein YidH (DUF202 family)